MVTVKKIERGRAPPRWTTSFRDHAGHRRRHRVETLRADVRKNLDRR
jgi:3'-phosphoadenosine 5'-phosphosulfate sulfotransferase